MMSIKRMIGLVGVGLLLATSLSGCIPQPLPDEERYKYIDNVLETIDYKTIGEIVKEEVDDGDGIFAPSYKVISYGNKGSFAELEKRLKASSDNCSGSQKMGQVNCQYLHANVRVFYHKKTNVDSLIESTLSITDGSSGRNN